MKRSTASRGAFAILVALPLLPVCGIVLNGPPAMVFFMGAMSFISGVMLLVCLFAISSIPLAGSPPVAKRFRFTIRDLLCLTIVLFGMTLFFVSAFRCEAAERASRPGPVPAVVIRQFVWELECGKQGPKWFPSASRTDKYRPRRLISKCFFRYCRYGKSESALYGAQPASAAACERHCSSGCH